MCGLPTDVGPAANFYCRDVYDKAGLASDPDSVASLTTTWEDFFATGEKIVAAGGQWMLANASEVFDIFRQQGVSSYFDEQGNPAVNTETFVNAAKYARDVRKAGLDSKVEVWGTEWGDMMIKKQIGSYPYAAWWDIILHAYTPDSGGSWGVVPMPGKFTADTPGAFWVIPEQSTKKEQAWAFASYANATLEGVDLYLKGGKGMWLPGWKPAYELPVFKAPDPYYADQIWLQIFVGIADKVPKFNYTVNDSMAASAVSEALTRVLEEDEDPQTAFDEANEKIKGMLG
jgi:cellobiose transport system substrate-binding protein